MAEKPRTYGVAILEIVLGIIQLIIASGIFSVHVYYDMMLLEMEEYNIEPTWMKGLYDAIGFIILFGAIYVLIHAIRRIVDHGLAAYVASKKEE